MIDNEADTLIMDAMEYAIYGPWVMSEQFINMLYLTLVAPDFATLKVNTA